MPTANGFKRDLINFSDVFDEEIFLSSIPENIIANEESDVNEVLTWNACFQEGARALSLSDDLARNVVLNLVANRELQKIADKIIFWLTSINAFALQLRIERDWQEYLTKKYGGINITTDNQELLVDVKRILEKTAKTDDFSGRSNIWCCCDEDDLLLSKDIIKSQANLLGYNIYFKTDLPEYIFMPHERVKKSIIDFSVCMGLDTFVGLDISTFSNQLNLMNKYGRCKNGARHYIYNNIGNELRRLI